MNDRLEIGGVFANDFALERRRVRASFDRAAERYDSAAGLQRRAAERLLAHVAGHNIDPLAILDAGCGTGYGAALLTAQYSEASLYCLDIAPSMLQRARTHLHAVPHICADAEHLPLKRESIDLLWSNVMLQWCNDLSATFAGFGRVMASDGLLAFSTFGPQTLAELRAAFDSDHTHVSRFADAAFIEATLRSVGFGEISIERRSTVLRYPDVAALMRSLKTIGAGNATAGRARGLTGKGRWRAMRERYEALRGPDGLPATYELLYVTARKVSALRRSV
ncbi:MAG TPA: malonyl-ACP O-methyltransferase BioC [Burkholderiales bacterium]